MPFATRDLDGTSRTVPYGGGALIEVGAELRFPLGSIRGFEVGGAVFVDGGDVRERRADLDPLDVHWASGAGLRIARASRHETTMRKSASRRELVRRDRRADHVRPRGSILSSLIAGA